VTAFLLAVLLPPFEPLFEVSCFVVKRKGYKGTDENKETAEYGVYNLHKTAPFGAVIARFLGEVKR